MVRWLTAGESHGPALVGIIEGLPAGIKVSSADIADQLARRRLGIGRSSRQRLENDDLRILGGVRHGLTLGSPIAFTIANAEWESWQLVMGPEALTEEQAAEVARSGRGAPLTRPRPGHADLAGMQKFGFDDARPVLERASARETAAKVALGAFARLFLHQCVGAHIVSHVVRIGDVAYEPQSIVEPGMQSAIDADPVRCADTDMSALMVQAIESAKSAGDTLGGVVEVVVHGLPVGLGSYVHADRKIDARLAGALMGIQAVKGVEVGDGFASAARRGSTAHDEIDAHRHGVTRRTNHAGGIEGGMTNGEPLRIRVAMKPISTVPRALATIDVATGEAATAHAQRSDICAVPALGVIAEAAAALALADAVVEKFGGDSMQEVLRNVSSYAASHSLRSRDQ